MRIYLPRSWISDKLTSGQSAIHGEGVFANRPIRAGERLMEFGGERLTPAQAGSGLYRGRSVWMAQHDLYLALPKSDPHPSLDEHLNHSCDANGWLLDEVTLVARRDIEAGEEITLDQGTWNFEEGEYTDDRGPCCCGAARCRGELRETDWTLAEVQERYAGHLHPVVQAMIGGKTSRAA